MYCETSNHFSMYNIRCSKSINFCAVPIPYIAAVSALCNEEDREKIPHRAAHAKEQEMVDVFIASKHLPFSPVDFHRKGDFDRKSSSAQSDGRN